MGHFSESELAYLKERRLARVATVGADGVPHVTPVGMWSYDSVRNVIEVSGRAFAATKKYRDVLATGKAAIVIDDLASTNPWRPRGVEIRGAAEAVASGEAAIAIHPDRIVSWGLD